MCFCVCDLCVCVICQYFVSLLDDDLYIAGFFNLGISAPLHHPGLNLSFITQYISYLHVALLNFIDIFL